jgi:UDP-N-acetylmuramate--alanine ligase
MIKKIYIVGIEGAGTSALAKIYHALGYDVSGSDNGDHFFGGSLKKLGIAVHGKFSEGNIPDKVDFAVYSTAFKEDNPEITEIRKRRIKLYSYPEALGELFNKKIGIAVCGTHGKTTTTALAAAVFETAGTDPSVVVGSTLKQWEGNARFGKGEQFILEADEYQNKLKFYKPWSAILTSADYDHPDFFPDFESYKKTFKDFVARIPKTGALVVWGDSSDTLEIAKHAKCKVLTYGFGEENDYKIKNQNAKIKIDSVIPIQEFEVLHKEESLGVFEIRMVGKHNALNAAAVIALAHFSGLDMEKVRKGLENFQGIKRRFEYVGVYDGDALLIDDYAHHPDEVRATLKGARSLYQDKKITVVFHPHSYTRTKALLEEFAQSFEDANSVIVIDIYGSARENDGDVSSEDLVKLINHYQYGKAEHVPTIEKAVEHIKSGEYGKDDVIIIMGAGDVWRAAEELKDRF